MAPIMGEHSHPEGTLAIANNLRCGNSLVLVLVLVLVLCFLAQISIGVFRL
jgi:hypothetical protein